METLNSELKTSCKISYQNYHKFNEIIIIKNFFENFESATSFLKKIKPWKPESEYNLGLSSILPSYLVRFFLQKFFNDNSLYTNPNSYSCGCNYWFYNMSKGKSKIKNFIGEGLIPHVDTFPNLYHSEYVCLVNLNSFPIETCFWSFEGKLKITDMNGYYSYLHDLNNLSKEKMKKEYTIKYKPNECIIYPANLLHSPILDSSNTEENPRISLRLSYNLEKIVYL